MTARIRWCGHCYAYVLTGWHPDIIRDMSAQKKCAGYSRRKSDGWVSRRGASHRELGRCRRIAIGISSVVGVRWTRAQLPAAPRRGEDAPRTLGRQKTSEKDKPRAGAASPGREAGETWNVFWGRSLSTKSSSATPVGGDGAEGCKHETRARTLSQGGCGRPSVRPNVCSQPEPQKQ